MPPMFEIGPARPCPRHPRPRKERSDCRVSGIHSRTLMEMEPASASGQSRNANWDLHRRAFLPVPEWIPDTLRSLRSLRRSRMTGCMDAGANCHRWHLASSRRCRSGSLSRTNLQRWRHHQRWRIAGTPPPPSSSTSKGAKRLQSVGDPFRNLDGNGTSFGERSISERELGSAPPRLPPRSGMDPRHSPLPVVAHEVEDDGLHGCRR